MSGTQTTLTYPSEQSRLFLPSQEALETFRLQASGTPPSDAEKSKAEEKIPGWTPVCVTFLRGLQLGCLSPISSHVEY